MASGEGVVVGHCPPGKEADACTSAQSMSGESVQTVDHAVGPTPDSRKADFERSEVVSHYLGYRTDHIPGPSHVRDSRGLLDSADDMAAPDESMDESVSQFSGEQNGSWQRMAAEAEDSPLQPFWTAGRQDSASYQALPPALVQRQDSASYQQEQEDRAGGLGYEMSGEMLLEGRVPRDSARDLSDDNSDAASSQPRPAAAGAAGLSGASRLRLLGRRASSGRQGRLGRSTSANDRDSSQEDVPPATSLFAVVHSSFLPSPFMPPSQGLGGPGGLLVPSHSLEIARRSVLGSFLPPATSPQNIEVSSQPPPCRQDSALHSLAEARWAVLAELGGSRSLPAHYASISPPLQLSVPNAEERLDSLEQVRRAVLADLASTRSLPAQAVHPGPSTSEPPAQFQEIGDSAHQHRTSQQGHPHMGPVEVPHPEARQDSALHTLMQARLAVLSEVGSSRAPISHTHTHSLDFVETSGGSETAGQPSGAAHRRSASALVRHSSLSAIHGGPRRAASRRSWRRSESGVLLEARRAVLADLAANPHRASDPLLSTSSFSASTSGVSGAPQLWRNSPIETIGGGALDSAGPLSPSPGPAVVLHPDSPMHQRGQTFGLSERDSPFLAATSSWRERPVGGGEASTSGLERRSTGYDSASELDL
eukprot:jgi/Botrbrau1/15576/Bobra.33_1s0005.1